MYNKTSQSFPNHTSMSHSFVNRPRLNDYRSLSDNDNRFGSPTGLGGAVGIGGIGRWGAPGLGRWGAPGLGGLGRWGGLGGLGALGLGALGLGVGSPFFRYPYPTPSPYFFYHGIPFIY